MSKRFDYTLALRGCSEWLNEASRIRMWEKPRSRLAEFTRHPAPAGCLPTIAGIEKLATWHARDGCVLIGNGQWEHGWQSLKRFFDYSVFSARMHLEIARLVHAPEATPTLEPFHLLGMALTFRDDAATRWLGSLIVEARSTNVLGHRWGGARRDQFRCYIHELYCRSIDQCSPSDDLGAYAGVFETWERPRDLADAIERICDYHVARSNVSGADEIGEFENNPYDLVPSEILALYRVRENLSLETLRIHHPLLDTPFAGVPETIILDCDPLVVGAMNSVGKLLPEAVANQ